MSWQNLPTDFTNVTWNGLRKYQVVDNGDNTFSFIDVTEYDNEEHSFYSAEHVNQTNEAVNDLWLSLTNVTASEFDDETEYAAGDYVIYDFKLYKFKVAHTGDWDDEDVDAVTIIGEIRAGSNVWGSIIGNIADQTDLMNLLNGKADANDTYTKQEVDTALSGKADADDTYTKQEVNTALESKADLQDLTSLAEGVAWDLNVLSGEIAQKANANDVYSKQQVDTSLSGKADKNDTYTKSQVDTALSSKANSADVYTKQQADTLLDKKLDTDSDTTITGSILTFGSAVENGIKGLSVGIEPVQDLHGQSAPYPAGGGKNQFPLTITEIKNAYPTFTWTNNEQTTNGVTWKLITDSISGDIIGISTSGTASPNASTIDIYNGTLKAGSYIYNTSFNEIQNSKDSFILVGGNVIARGVSGAQSFTLTEDSTIIIRLRIANGIDSGGAVFKPMIRLSSVTDATFAPYSNICPISGHTSAVVTRTGKNLFNVNDYYSLDSRTTIENNAVNLTASFAPAEWRYYLQSGTYSISHHAEGLASGIKTTFQVYGLDSTFLDARCSVNGNNGASGNASTTFTITTPMNVRIRIYMDANSQTPVVVSNSQIELSSIASPYEPYQGETLTIDLDGTRYGGTLNVPTGEMTVTHYFVTIDGTQTINKHSTTPYNGYFLYLNANDLPACASTADGTVGQFNYYKLGKLNVADCNAFVGSNTIQFRNDAITTANDMVTYLTQHPLQVVYPLATPLTVQLSPAEVSTLIGQNVLWCDTGNSTAILRTGAGQLAYQDSIDYNSDYLKNKPTLGTMSAESASDYYDKDEVEDLINASGVTAELDASGSIAMFETRLAENLSKLSVQIEPVQDLHGYDAPWSAGGGKNVLPAYDLALLKSRNTAGTWNGDAYTQDGITFTFTFGEDGLLQTVIANGTATNTISFRITPQTIENTFNGYYLNGAPNLSGCRMQIYDQTTDEGTTVSSTGSVITYTNGDLVRFFVYITSGTQLTNAVFKPIVSANNISWSPYSNICPISGHSSAVVTRSGKNLFDPDNVDGSSTSEVMTFEYVNDVLKLTSHRDNVLYEQVRYKIIPAKCVYGKTIRVSATLKSKPNGTNPYVFMAERYDGNYLWRVDTQGSIAVGDRITLSQNVTDDRGYITVSFYASNGTVVPVDSFTEYSNIMFEVSDTVSDYETPNVQSVTISLGDTRYGGVLDAVNGILTVTKAIKQITSSLSFESGTGWNDYAYQVQGFFSDGKSVSGYNTIADLICSHADITTPILITNQSGYSIGVGQGSGTRLYINLGMLLADLQTYLTNNDVYVVYPLATPLTVSLTPAQVQALAGKNFVWASTGDVALSYYDSNTEEAINDTKQMIADMTDQMVAPKNLTANEFIVVNKHLYKVTANVASGSNLVIGTNVVETTVAEQLTYLLSQL